MDKYISLLASLIMLIPCTYIIYKWRKNGVIVWQAIGTKFKGNTYIEIVVGILIGFIAMLGIFEVESRLKLINIIRMRALNTGLISLFLYVGYRALAEEVISRGLMLNGLIAMLNNKYIAVLITGVVFGLLHAGNSQATYISIISNGLGGIMYSIAYLGSGSLWLPFSLHFAWNFFQGPVFGFPVSGSNMEGLIVQTPILNKNVFNGGGYGPEAGLIGLAFRLVVITLLLLYFHINSKVVRHIKGENKSY